MDYGREEEDMSFLFDLRHITHPLFIFGGAMNERDFQKKLIKQLKTMFPGIEIMKQDAGYKFVYPENVNYILDELREVFK